MILSRPRVLLAEDHPGVARALLDVLQPHCDVVSVISDGGEVVDEATRLQPVISVVDVNMPNVNGLDICRLVRAATPDAKVIVISGMMDDSIVEEALAAGASDCINKARAASQLLVAVRQAWTEAV